jgi:hypothetical protein
MREISDLEKHILDQICKERTHISKLLVDHIPNLIMKIDRDNEKVSLKILERPNQRKSVIDTAVEQTEMIIYIIEFLLYLDERGYIMTGKFAHGTTIQGHFVTEENFRIYNQNQSDYTNWDFTDKEIEKYIFNYCDLTIFPSYVLKIFKKSGYRTKEDKRHHQTLFVSYFAILVSLLLGFWSIYQITLGDQPTKKQMDQLIVSVKNIKIPDNLPTSTQIDTLIKRSKSKK